MKAPLKLMIVAGARPNFMKITPLVRRIISMAESGIDCEPSIRHLVVHTGQHYDQRMSGNFFRELGVPEPHINLDVRSGSHAVQTANLMLRFEPLCQEIKPDWVVVVGDVNSTMACTLVCAKLGIKIAHVEAGLRSFDRTMPEEINRLVTDTLADLLLTPSADAEENLAREGVGESKRCLVGNIMIDTLVANLQKAQASKILDNCGVQPKSFAYVTLHRPSNVDDPASLTAIMAELRRISGQLPVVFSMHPRTRKMCCQFGISCAEDDQFRLLEPIGYCDSICLTENARFVLTDSGGLQEESTYFRTPCLTLRPNTERPITITLGSNKLTSLDRMAADVSAVLNGELERGQVPPLWDGHAADRIVDSLIRHSAA